MKINKPTQEDLSPRMLTEEEEPLELKSAAGRGHVGVEQGAEVCNGAEGGAQHDRDSRGDSFLADMENTDRHEVGDDVLK